MRYPCLLERNERLRLSGMTDIRAMSDASLPWLSMGQHLYRFEGPDVLHFRASGLFSNEQFREILNMLRERADERGVKVFWLADVSSGMPMDTKSRELSARIDASKFVLGMAAYGGSFQLRVAANLSLRAVRFLSRGTPMPPILFCSTEVEARAFLEEVRRGEHSQT